MNTIGIDLGLSGGIAVITDAGTPFLHRVPTIKKTVNKKARRTYDISAITDSMERLGVQGCEAYIEAAGMRPGQATQAAKTTGYGEGMYHAILVGAGIPYTIVYPQQWKRAFDLIGKDKADSIAAAF